MKKINSLFIFLAFPLLFLFAGCAQKTMTISPNPEQSSIVNIEEKKPELNTISVYHWWSSGGEAAAISALSQVFVDAYPDTAAMITPILGAGGMEMIAKIKPMILAHEAPDSFVAHPGYEILPYVNEGLLQPVDDIWASEYLEDYIPEAVQQTSKINGRYYTIPLDIHRSNLVWYNKTLTDKYGIDVSTLTDWDSFFEACDKLRDAGMQYPIQMGRTWTATYSFHNIVLSQGVDFYQDYINGKITSAEDPRLKKSLEIFKKYLSYVNPDSADISWNEATSRVIKGESAFNMMGDWANGEFSLIGMKFNGNYGAFSSPGSDGIHLVVDAFVKPEGISHPTNSNNWLKTVASREGQDAFNPKKGSISARSDSDRSVYDDYQKSAMDYLQSSRLVVDVGTALPYEYRKELDNIMAQFVIDRDVDAALEKITTLTTTLQDQYLITWSIK